MEKEIWKPSNMLNPVPAVMVSCGREGETPNIVTIAWAGTVCSDPVMVSISVRPTRHSYGIIKDTGEFVINLVNTPLTKACDYCGVKTGAKVNKWEDMHLTPLPSQVVRCPGIAESPVNLECKVKEVIPLGSHDLFLAEVVSVTVDRKYLDENGRFDINAANLVAYSHGEYYELGEYLGKFGYSVQKSEPKKGTKKKS
ncbi:MAG: flavin reductase family protein [Lachnospiraceae bacterium]|nr:flavin reductase family protein [Lachnospiraceae bacterium]